MLQTVRLSILSLDTLEFAIFVFAVTYKLKKLTEVIQ